MLWSLLRVCGRFGRGAETLFVVPDAQNAAVPLLARALAHGQPGCAVLATVPSLQALYGAFGRAPGEDVVRSVRSLLWTSTATPALADRADVGLFSRLVGDEPADAGRFASSNGHQGINMGLSRRPWLSPDDIAGLGRDGVLMIPHVGDTATGERTPVLARVAHYKTIPELNELSGPNPFVVPPRAEAA